MNTNELIAKLTTQVQRLKNENLNLKQKLLIQHSCEECENVFKTKTQLEEHMINHHFRHPELAKTSYNLYKGSSVSIHSDTEWNQVQGPKQKPRTSQDQVQIQTVSKNPFQFSNFHNCDHCDEIFDSQNELTEHINKDHQNILMEHEESEDIN